MKTKILMKMMTIFLSFIIIYSGCSGVNSNENPMIFPVSEKFGDYWYQGKAELNRFELSQFRYGEIRKGDAVLIFVTEDFLKDKQVKYEFGDDKSNVQTVLKLNFNRRYYTGVYPYSLLTSTFLPINSSKSHALKITFTAQEWCGHMFMQLNNRDDEFNIQQNSYFQAEGDKEFNLDHALLEDEVWTLIRINPDLLKTGDFKVIPSMQYVRLFHKDYQSALATVEKKEVKNSDLSPNALIEYSIKYHELPRSLSILYEKDFPHQILAWEEGYSPLEDDKGGDMLVTRAVRTNKLMLDYWSKNSVADSVYRFELGMKQ